METGDDQAKTIHLGGMQAADEERIYPKDATFTTSTGDLIEVKESFIPDVNMADLFARHKARYYLVGLFCRPSSRVLDFPCGPGYAAEILSSLGVIYEGRDLDPITVEYAQQVYGGQGVQFGTGDLCSPKLPRNHYDVIGCIEGLEHISMDHQDALITSCRDALKEHGVLVVSSPENLSGVSGQSPDNKWHVGELTKEDFLALLCRHFPTDKVELLTHSAILSTGKRSNIFYGICHT